MQKWQKRPTVWIGGILQRLSSDDQGLQWRNLSEKSRSILDRQGEGTGYHPTQGPSNNEQAGDHFCGHNQNSSKEGGKFARIAEAVSALLVKYACIPLCEIRNLIPSNHPDFNMALHNPINDKYFLSACNLFQLKLNALSLNDFRDHYSRGSPVFYANNLDPFVYYHTREESAAFLIDLLTFQYGDDTDQIKMLLSNIVSWFNKKGWHMPNAEGKLVINPKINCVCIVGPPNSGKNYFWDTIAAIATNVGHIGRVSNKCNQFSLQDAYNRRLVMGNELSMEDGAKEDFKKLCEGSAFNIRVKFQGDKIFTRTPVCFITNGDLDISWDPHFRDVRMKTLRWSSCPLLAKSMKKPYPLALFDVFDYFEVDIQ